MFKVIVGNQAEKQELIAFTKYLQDNIGIYTNIPIANTLTYLYLAEHLIEVAEVNSVVSSSSASAEQAAREPSTPDVPHHPV